jgi:hypothetical protein
MTSYNRYLGLFLIATLMLLSGCGNKPGSNVQQINTLPFIFPEYIEVTLPPNIAPLNFSINEKAKAYYVEIEGIDSKISISSQTPDIQIPEQKWHKLLEASKGKDLSTKVYTQSENGQWSVYQTIVNHVANENIDSHLAYRLINAGYVLWHELGIYQRNLENFDESVILENKAVKNACMNCHSFCQNDPSKMMFHVRKLLGGTILCIDGKLKKVNTKTPLTMSAGVYPSWHPSGKFIAYSVNIIGQNFSSVHSSKIEVSDKASDLVVYDVEKNIINTAPQVSTPNRENLPTWSPDGKWLYYTSAPKVSNEHNKIYDRYSLVRISFDVNTGKWGQPDTVLSASKCGFSISFPKISPDGRFLVFTTSDYGYFTIHHADADLYMLDLQTLQYKKLNVNSNQTESYHSWSSNGRWLAFSSKRIDGLYARPFFCYVDNEGNTSKPFVMPQKDPTFYKHFLKNYNIPELIKGKVDVSPNQIRDKVWEDAEKAEIDPLVQVDGLSGATWIESHKDKK